VRVLVTGASGFVGRALVARLQREAGWNVRCAVRGAGVQIAGCAETIVMGDIERTDFGAAVGGVDAVVHLAARVHHMRDSDDAAGQYRETNTEATRRLAQHAAAAGVRRFVFLSTVKVNGDSGMLRETDETHPAGPYATSKWDAECALRDLAGNTGMEIVIVRPPLVYGPGVRANFAALMRAVVAGVPLPLGAVHNARSLVAVDNLVDFIVTCVRHPAAANEVFFVSDGRDLSTSELVRLIARAAGRRARLLAVPTGALRLLGRMTRRTDAIERLVGSLTVDITKARTRLHWSPPLSVEEGVRRAVTSVGRHGS
jgi:nucleoside-diphosphate-sugar epimerase